MRAHTHHTHAQASSRQDPWSTLGIPPTTDEKQIRKAYRSLALRHHPDVDPSEAAHARFIAIQEAYEIVSGKRRGKDDAPGQHSWEFHDWYVGSGCVKLYTLHQTGIGRFAMHGQNAAAQHHHHQRQDHHHQAPLLCTTSYPVCNTACCMKICIQKPSFQA